MNPPRVSFLCPTFGRCPDYLHLLGEVVECFLRQDYPIYRRELVILNDTPGQLLIPPCGTFNGKDCQLGRNNIRIYNYPERIPSLGAKLNELVRLAVGDVLLRNDDDDLSLPGRARQAVEVLGCGYGYFNPQRTWWLDGKVLHSDHNHGCCQIASAFTRAAWEAVGGFWEDLADSCASDQTMDRRLKSHPAVRVAPPLGSDPATWTYVYCWQRGWHLSGGGHPALDWQRRGEQSFPAGSWHIVPGYTEATRAALGKLLGQGG